MPIRKIKLTGSGFAGETAYAVGSHRVGRAGYIASICENAAYEGGTRLYCTCEESWDGTFCEHLAEVANFQESEAQKEVERQAKIAALISRIAPDYRGTDIERALALHRQTLKEKVDVTALTVAQLRRVIVRNNIGGSWTARASKQQLQTTLIERGYAAAA